MCVSRMKWDERKKRNFTCQWKNVQLKELLLHRVMEKPMEWKQQTWNSLWIARLVIWGNLDNPRKCFPVSWRHGKQNCFHARLQGCGIVVRWFHRKILHQKGNINKAFSKRELIFPSKRFSRLPQASRAQSNFVFSCFCMLCAACSIAHYNFLLALSCSFFSAPPAFSSLMCRVCRHFFPSSDVDFPILLRQEKENSVGGAPWRKSFNKSKKVFSILRFSVHRWSEVK